MGSRGRGFVREKNKKTRKQQTFTFLQFREGVQGGIGCISHLSLYVL
jgi:hypothetical protein